MNRDQYQPGAPGNVRADRGGERWTIVFTRELRHPPESVWEALTDPKELREWAPFDPDRNLDTLGDATLTMAGGGDEQTSAYVRIAERPRLLEYTWDTDVLRWELEPTATGTRLTLRHTTDREWAARVSAGWHICIDVMELFLDGNPIGRIAGDEAKAHGWGRLNDAYAAQLGIENNPAS